ncbi:hypothetical protein CASFOL_018307 [Castilleja foliolosa]|uniref:carnosine N-methyltransferase n=1 Tax=Castilleja foliolosa TaxID=1961234 RepID=A0ABD3D7R0_9LAMI
MPNSSHLVHDLSLVGHHASSRHYFVVLHGLFRGLFHDLGLDHALFENSLHHISSNWNMISLEELVQHFEPPIVDIDIPKDETMENTRLLSGEMSLIPCQSGLKSGKVRFDKADEVSSGDVGVEPDGPFLKPEVISEEKKIEHKSEIADANGFQIVKTSLSSTLECDGHVSSASPDWLNPSLQFHVPLVDVDKVRCIIRNIIRDWAPEGQRERDECYKPILYELERIFPHRPTDSPPSCLIPGAGLGRLALEISCLAVKLLRSGRYIHGYIVIVIRFQIMISFVLFRFQIFIQQGITEGFSMCGGDFVEVYSDPSQVGVWDAVVTCFFLDTAHNIVEYIEIISKILKDGGVWINLGPLLYHFADTYNHDDEMSIELTLEDVKRVACHYGFEIEKESTISTTYTTNVRSMMQYTVEQEDMEQKIQEDANKVGSKYVTVHPSNQVLIQMMKMQYTHRCLK